MNRVKKYKKIIIHCALIFMALFFVLRFAKERYFDMAMNAYLATGITQGDGSGQALKEKNGVMTQEFTVTTDELWGLGLSFESRQEEPQGKIEIAVTDEADKQLYQAIKPISDIQNDVTYWVLFDEIIENSKGKTITLELQVRNIADGDVLKIFIDPEAPADIGNLSIGNEELAGSIKVGQIYAQSAYLDKVFWLFVIIVALFIYGLYFALSIKKWSIEVIFLIFMVFAGIMYAFLVKPGAIPDESAHYRTAYAYSNVLVGKSDSVRDEVFMDEIDYEFYKTIEYREPHSSMYRDFQTDFLRRAPRGEMVATDRWAVRAPIYLYAGPVIGVGVGRLLGLNGLTVFYLGRFINALVFAGLAFWAMKKLPYYKMSLFALCLFPMTAHLAGSFSYDGMILAIALVLVAHILNLAFGKGEQNKLKELIIIAIASILLGGCKGGAYMPLLGLVFLIPMRYFKNKKQKLLFGGIVVGCTMAMFIMTTVSTIGSSISTPVRWSQTPSYTVGWIFANPMDFIQLLSNTVAVQSGFLFESLIGSELGWFNIPISIALVVSFFGIFMLSCVYVKESPARPLLVPKQKVGIGIALLFSVAMMMAGMMFSWTPMGMAYIEGMQGRYFLPLLLPLAFCLKNNNLTLQKSLDRAMIFMLAWLHIMVFISVFGVTFIRSV